jgi:hypothetical protein
MAGGQAFAGSGVRPAIRGVMTRSNWSAWIMDSTAFSRRHQPAAPSGERLGNELFLVSQRVFC